MLIKRLFILCAVLGVGTPLVLRFAHFNDDLVTAIESGEPELAKVFRGAQNRALFQNTIFVKIKDPKIDLTPLLDSAHNLGYHQISLQSTEMAANNWDWRLLNFLPPNVLQQHVASIDEQQVADQIKQIVTLPGSGPLARQIIMDPLNLRLFAWQQWIPGTPGSSTVTGQPIIAFARGETQDLAKAASFYDLLMQSQAVEHVIGGDIFAVENKDVVTRDIWVCTTVSIIASLVMFYLLSPSWSLVSLLLIGTWMSYLVSALALLMFFPNIYSIVLTFTATFIGFNNEYLVHFSGISPEERRRVVVGLGSAIGTTLIGFVVLLWGKTAVSVQFGVAAIGGMIGFLAFLWLFRDSLQKVRFRTLSWPVIYLRPKALVTIVALSIIAMWSLGKPVIGTDLNSFRYSSQRLTESAEYFASGMARLPVPTVAVAVTDPWQFFHNLSSQKSPNGIKEFHPFNFYVEQEEQNRREGEIFPVINRKLGRIQQLVQEAGVPIAIGNLPAATALSSEEYLGLWNQMMPVKWSSSVDGQNYLHLIKPVESEPNFLPITPKEFYEYSLNRFQGDLAWLLVIGSIIMVLYLLPWQMSLWRVLYIFTPLLLAITVFLGYLHLMDKPLNIVHVISYSLIIALAIDYSSILTSSAYAPKEVSKVVLTGIIALTSFGALIFADHPLIWELGVTVWIGVATALLFSLTIRLDPHWLPAGKCGNNPEVS